MKANMPPSLENASRGFAAAKSTLFAVVFTAMFAVTSALASAPFSYPPSAANGWPMDSTTQQSPIDFNTVAPQPPPLGPIKVFVEQPGTFSVHDQNLDFGTTVQLSGPGVGNLFPGASPTAVTPITVLGFHFHCPVEHILPTPGDFELHVKAVVGGATCVFAIQFRALSTAPASPTVGDMFLGTVSGTLLQVNPNLPPPAAVPSTAGLLGYFVKNPFYAYVGSLTTPPCTGGVQWFVLKDPIPYTAFNWTLLYALLQQRGMPYKNGIGNNRTPPQTVLPGTNVYLVTPD